MKRLIRIFALSITIALLVSACGSNAYDLNISKLKTPCDFVNASLLIYKEKYELRQKVGSGTPDQKQRQQMRQLDQKFTEMVIRLENIGYDLEEFEEKLIRCRNYKKAKYYYDLL